MPITLDQEYLNRCHQHEQLRDAALDQDYLDYCYLEELRYCERQRLRDEASYAREERIASIRALILCCILVILLLTVRTAVVMYELEQQPMYQPTNYESSAVSMPTTMSVEVTSLRDEVKQLKAKTQQVEHEVKTIKKEVKTQPKQVTSKSKLTKKGGVNYFNGRKETWYSQRVLPGGGLRIPGRHVDSAGLIKDRDNYICVAASDVPKGTVLYTSLGVAKVYDTGCAPGTTDIYTDW